MPRTGGSLRRDPLSVRYDTWARAFLEVLKADPWNWHGRWIASGTVDPGGLELTHNERAAQRSLWWNLGHAASSGLRIRPEWSLQVTWGRPIAPMLLRQRLLTARVTPKEAGQRSVLVRGRSSYIANPTSRGARAGEDWQPKG
ncbi:MAG TPA: hypothetical protein VGR98_12260 [Streptosporangiaceae bacterium]|nr:hypothetical protein [Streptosporangiaceae bacterium]